jgi:hypothetical protein
MAGPQGLVKIPELRKRIIFTLIVLRNSWEGPEQAAKKPQSKKKAPPFQCERGGLLTPMGLERGP